MTEPDISIIIPVYNREQLVIDTITSIKKQTFESWECIFIDDGSTDNSKQVIENTVKGDSRFILVDRNNKFLKGACGCRNFGLHLAAGKYIMFFDSDDLMVKNHLEIKFEAIDKHDLDYVITRTKYFNHSNYYIDKYYQFRNRDISADNYITQKINWLTYDVLIARDLATSIFFNELLKSGQEYNYFCKLVLKSTKTIFLDKVVTLRRHHENSIRSSLNNSFKNSQSKFNAFWYTYLDIKNEASYNAKKQMMIICIKKIAYERKVLTPNRLKFLIEVIRVFNLRSVYYLLMLLSINLFDRSYYFSQKLCSDV